MENELRDKIIESFKNPLRWGIVKREEKEGDNFVLYDEQTPEQEVQGELKVVFEDGIAYNIQTLAEIRTRFHPVN